MFSVVARGAIEPPEPHAVLPPLDDVEALAKN